jgi:pyrroline-5-carboxylate reductase
LQEIPSAAATRYVGSMFAGLAEATRSGERFQELAREYATSGGTNEQFLNELEQGGTFEHVSLGLQRILDRLTTT